MSAPPAVRLDVDTLLSALRAAKTYDLEQPRYFGAPSFAAHAPGFVYSLHRRHELGLGEARTSASGMVVMADHSGTHIDALCHQAEHLQMFGGRQAHAGVQTPTGFTELGAETIAPVIARGVLLDVARHGLPPTADHPAIRVADLEKTLAAEDVSIGQGDVVLVRTGAGALWERPIEYERGPGIGRDCSGWLAERGVAAVGADNLAWDAPEVIEPDGGTLPGHVILIVHTGIYILENLFLEEIAQDGCYEFLFLCLPLKMSGATGSPVRPIAILPANSTSTKVRGIFSRESDE